MQPPYPSVTLGRDDALHQNRQSAFERYASESKRLDEVTDMAERLAAPMETCFDYTFDADDNLCFMGQSIKKVFDGGVVAAHVLVQDHPELEFELRRRELERLEYDDMVAFARHVANKNEIMVTISPVPDAVMRGVAIDGYNRERQKTMIRLCQRIDDGVRVTSISLDVSDRDGLRAIARLCRETIAYDESSEDILARRFLLDTNDRAAACAAATTLRHTYDAVLRQKYGGIWYGGRQDDTVRNTYDFIMTHGVVIDAHMQAIAAIQQLASSGGIKDALLEDARYNCAAQLRELMQGNLQVDAGGFDIEGAGNRARADGVHLGRECATGATSAYQAVETMMGRREEFKRGTCRVCLKDTGIGACSVCASCEDADNKGINLATINKRARRMQKAVMNNDRRTYRNLTTHPPSKTERLLKAYGDKAVIHNELAIGGIRSFIIDKRDGSVLYTL